MSSEGRFSVSEQALVSPGQCFICQSITGAPFIDTMVDVPGRGVFYLCKRCIDEMNSLFADAVKSRDEELDEAFAAGIKVGEERAWQVAKDTLNAAMGNALPSAGHDIPVRPTTVPDVEGTSEADAGDSGSTEGKPQRNKSNGSNASKQGPDDVSSVEGDGDIPVFRI